MVPFAEWEAFSRSEMDDELLSMGFPAAAVRQAIRMLGQDTMENLVEYILTHPVDAEEAQDNEPIQADEPWRFVDDAQAAGAQGSLGSRYGIDGSEDGWRRFGDVDVNLSEMDGGAAEGVSDVSSLSPAFFLLLSFETCL